MRWPVSIIKKRDIDWRSRYKNEVRKKVHRIRPSADRIEGQWCGSKQ